MTYPALCLVLPPFQFPFAGPALDLHPAQTDELRCFVRPHEQCDFDLHAGHRRWRLVGTNVRRHSAQIFGVMSPIFTRRCDSRVDVGHDLADRHGTTGSDGTARGRDPEVIRRPRPRIHAVPEVRS